MLKSTIFYSILSWLKFNAHFYKVWNLGARGLIFEPAINQYHIGLGKSYAKLTDYETFNLI